MLNSLITVASIYSPESPSVTVGAERDGTSVAISVTGEVVSIPTENLSRLARRFFQIDARNWRGDPRGPDMGLAIYKRIVEAHGGRIWVEIDCPGSGDRIAFTLPSVEVAAPIEASSSDHSRPTPSKNGRILAVDDDPQTRRYIRKGIIPQST